MSLTDFPFPLKQSIRSQGQEEAAGRLQQALFAPCRRVRFPYSSLTVALALMFDRLTVVTVALQKRERTVQPPLRTIHGPRPRPSLCCTDQGSDPRKAAPAPGGCFALGRVSRHAEGQAQRKPALRVGQRRRCPRKRLCPIGTRSSPPSCCATLARALLTRHTRDARTTTR